jgi:limonene-1,2-epoxide hydrolase
MQPSNTPLAGLPRENEQMSIAETFFEYAQAFEKTFKDDDWSRLERYFTPDAIYLPGNGQEMRGRENVLAYLKQSLDTFDRRFDSRRVSLLADPVVTSSQVTIQWQAAYEKQGMPDVVLTGVEEATFEGDAISRLEDTLDDGVAEALETWTSEHGDSLAGGDTE